MIEALKHPWPWYIGGAIIGLIIPALLIFGNKHFGISANLRHICAACFPAGIKFFKYDWKKETWNLFFIGGIFIGSVIADQILANPEPIKVNHNLATTISSYGIDDYSNIVPKQIFNFEYLLTLKGLIIMIGGGFLVGFGSRYAGGCTSGHSITGLSYLQLPSLIATIMFMAGGFLVVNLILPIIMKL